MNLNSEMAEMDISICRLFALLGKIMHCVISGLNTRTTTSNRTCSPNVMDNLILYSARSNSSSSVRAVHDDDVKTLHLNWVS